MLRIFVDRRNLRLIIESVNVIYRLAIMNCTNNVSSEWLPLTDLYLRYGDRLESILSRYRTKRDGLNVFVLLSIICRLYLGRFSRMIPGRQLLINRQLMLVAYLSGYSKSELLFLETTLRRIGTETFSL